MKQQYLNIVDTFLSASIYNKALLIDGKWGIGKTYFIKETVREYIENKDKKFIYISVNGSSSVDEVRVTLLKKALKIPVKGASRFLKLENSKYGQWITTASNKLQNLLEKGAEYAFKNSAKYESYYKLYEFYKYIGTIDLVYNLKNTVFCFDDIERLSEKLKLDDLLGMISTEIIEKGGKVILVGNIEKGRDKDKLYEVAEKYIGWNLNYAPKSEAVVNSILEKQVLEAQFGSFINRNKTFIKKACVQINLKNYRTFLFFLEILKKIHGLIGEEYMFLDKDIIAFSLLFAVEEKSGDLKKVIKRGQAIPEYITKTYLRIDDNGDLIYSNNEGQDKKHEEEFNNKVQLIYNGLIEESISYYFIEPIYNLIRNGSLSKEDLIKDLDTMKKKFRYIKGKIADSAIYGLFHFMKGTSEEYEKNIKEIKRRLSSMDFSIYSIDMVINRLVWLNEEGLVAFEEGELEMLIGKNINKLKDEFCREYESIHVSDLLLGFLEERTGKYKKIFKDKYDDWEKEISYNNKLTVLNNISNDNFDYQEFMNLFTSIEVEQIFQFLKNNKNDKELIEKIKGSISNYYRTSHPRNNEKNNKIYALNSKMEELEIPSGNILEKYAINNLKKALESLINSWEGKV